MPCLVCELKVRGARATGTEVSEPLELKLSKEDQKRYDAVRGAVRPTGGAGSTPDAKGPCSPFYCPLPGEHGYLPDEE